jgi:uncharacterized protein (UPF0261 family)
MTKTVVIIGTLDTKGPEIRYLRDKVKKQGDGMGLEVVVIDSGILGQPAGIVPDISRDEVAAAAGLTLQEIRNAGSRGAAVHRMTDGVRNIVLDLYRQGRCHGVACIGGVEGAMMACAAMEALPVGVAKVVATPLASGSRKFSLFVDTKDITIMHSVIDILGVNALSCKIYDNVAGAVVGMVQAADNHSFSGERLVGVTMLGNTTAGIMHLKPQLEAAGYEPVIFHSSGIGGRSMEDLARAGAFCGIIDYTTNEIFEDVIGGFQAGAGPDRLTVAAELGVPQVVCPGSTDFFDWLTSDPVPDDWSDRKTYLHSPTVWLMRLRRDELVELGRMFAERLNPATAPTAVAFPLRGTSIPNHPDGIFYDPELDKAFLQSLKDHLRPGIEVVEVDAHINDSQFADAVFSLFQDVMSMRERV